jgi:uncharacterized membrane protein
MSGRPGTGDTRTSPRRFPPLEIAVLGLAVLGVLVASYLVYEHFTSATSFACPANGAVDCVKVTTSTWSEFLGLPVAVLGLAFFVGMIVLSVPPVSTLANVRRVRLVGSAVGVLFVLYLVWAELFRIDAICLWCTGVHVITLALFAVLAVEAALAPVAEHA